MSLSTNSIIHYTSSLKSLKAIIAEGFKVKYCLEEILTSEKPLSGAFPMVCFCDIPLSNVKDHIKSYGHYGLGLTKIWAISKGINPVLYLDKHSPLSGKIFQQGRRALNDKGELQQDWLNNFLQICSYIKNYQGDLVRKSKTFKNYRFYNEREWRYVPTSNLLTEFPNVVTQAKYLSDKIFLNDLAGKMKLTFNINDISYVIVKNENDIPTITKHLKNNYKTKCTSQELDNLLTKIITVNQIKGDF